MGRYYDSYWPPYVPVAERQRRAAQKIAKMKKSGQDVSPVEIVGRKIAATFWGDAWCRNLEAYSDYANRLPRGRTYVRNGLVLDLQIDAGRVRALVSGTKLYTLAIKIKTLPKKKWTEIKTQCAGQIDSLVELLQGSFSKSVMEIVSRKGEGLFPSPQEITLSCSCPDWASMCKHVAATLYGVGARLDHEPELLFTLRGVDPTEMVEAAVGQPTAAGKAPRGRVLETDQLSSVFGIEIDMHGVSPDTSLAPPAPAKRIGRAAKSREPAASKTTKKKAAKPKTTRMSATSERTAAKPKTTRKSVTSEKATAKRKNTAKRASRTNTAAKKPTTKRKSIAERASRTNAAAKKPTTKTARAKKPARKKASPKTSSAQKSTNKVSAVRVKKPRA